jgi:hypothetical protein
VLGFYRVAMKIPDLREIFVHNPLGGLQ